jgi:hypothetical protein
MPSNAMRLTVHGLRNVRTGFLLIAALLLASCGRPDASGIYVAASDRGCVKTPKQLRFGHRHG